MNKAQAVIAICDAITKPQEAMDSPIEAVAQDWSQNHDQVKSHIGLETLAAMKEGGKQQKLTSMSQAQAEKFLQSIYSNVKSGNYDIDSVGDYIRGGDLAKGEAISGQRKGGSETVQIKAAGKSVILDIDRYYVGHDGKVRIVVKSEHGWGAMEDQAALEDDYSAKVQIGFDDGKKLNSDGNITAGMDTVVLHGGDAEKIKKYAFTGKRG